ncbi:solute carrier family 4 [Aureococcus anophagefferens]|nr:solute carrier family 4 [Aureococcus anophagefferens]
MSLQSWKFRTLFLPRYLKTNRGFMEYGGEINSTLKDGEKHAKDAKLHERLETKLRKLNRCRSDNQRLLSKEGGADGLSDGQKRAFDVNDAQIAKLTDEIADLEETIRGRNAQRDAGAPGRDDGDDDGYLYEAARARSRTSSLSAAAAAAFASSSPSRKARTSPSISAMLDP